MADSTETPRSFPIALACCLSMAIGVRLAAILAQANQLTVDRDVYLAIAEGLAAGRGYSVPDSTVPTAYRPPLYPLCLAAARLVCEPALAVAVVNLLTGVCTVWCVFRLAGALGMQRLSLAAGLLVAIDPLLLRYTAQPMTESMSAFLSALWLLTVTTANRAETISPRRGFLNGVVFGLLVLCRPTFWPLAGFCALIWLLPRDDSQRPLHRTARLAQGLTSILGLLIIVSPWVVRNQLELGVPILTTTHGGYTLLLGNNPTFYREVVAQPWGTIWPDASQQKWEVDLRHALEEELGPHPAEPAADAWQSRQAQANMAAEPRACLAAVWHRVRSLWSPVPLGEPLAGLQGRLITLTGWWYVALFGLAIIGAVLAALTADRRWLPLLALVLTVQSVHLFYWTNARMRAPLVPVIALLATRAMSRVWPDRVTPPEATE